MRIAFFRGGLMPLVALTAVILAPAAVAQSGKPAAASNIGGATPHLIGQFGDWAAYTAAPGNRPVCFALSKPTSGQTSPANRRDESMVVYMFISTRPKEKVKDEVSILVTGYAFKPGSDATATIGSANFALYTQNDGAWIKNAAEEARMVDAMRKGADLVVKATTSRGTETTDNFSLKGIAEALDRVAQQCK